MKIKTNELTGAALNWAVEMAECEGAMYSGRECRPFSTDWAQGGPIIEREGINLSSVAGITWCADGPVSVGFYGPTPLIAAMRCYVASKLGNEVDIPELTESKS